ncbi:unnamed protein product [Prorocentrum cordatum]|uniref:SSD domain-containing protein n=1 Tax=Prorocentrum cordatum TaxID=2364126 RepID=A0ABN9Q0L9_9DINO|nr:unnamed protein product [Polarella glacialis]
MLLSLISVATGAMNITQDDLAWSVFDADSTRAWKAWTNARELADPESAQDRRLSGSGPPADKPDGGLVDYEFGGSEWWSFTFLYKSDLAGSGNVFTPERLQEMCRLEALVSSQPSTWVVSDSAARLFYDGQAEQDSCALLAQGTVTARLDVMFADVSANGPSSQYARFVHPSFASTGESAYSRTSMSITGGDKDEKEHKREITEDVILSDLGLSYGFLRSALQVEEDRFQPSGPLRVRLAYRSEEIDWMINDDFTLALGAVLVVFLVIYLHLQSCFLACTSILQILMSLPVASIFYTYVWGVSFFDFLHILTVYLVLGIGADDVFVLFDAFRHVSEEHPLGNGLRYSEKTLAHILQTTLERSGQAIFNTTFTTTVAFLSQSVSALMPMRTLGYYASTCIAMNFVFTMLWTPSALIIHHKRLEGKRCCCPGLLERHEDLGVAGDTDKEGAQVQSRSRGGLSGCIEMFLQKVYIPMMRKQVAGVRVVALVVSIVVLAVAIQGVYFTSQLTPPTKAEVWIPDNHMHLEVSQFWSNTFYEADYEKYAIITFTWGISGLDDSELSEYEPSKTPPTATFDPAFDITTAAAHAEILEVCAEMQTLKCQLEGCQGYGDTLMISTQDKAYSCFLEDGHEGLLRRRRLAHGRRLPRKARGVH